MCEEKPKSEGHKPIVITAKAKVQAEVKKKIGATYVINASATATSAGVG